MRTMVEDNQVHRDVINTLWQVYSEVEAFTCFGQVC